MKRPEIEQLARQFRAGKLPLDAFVDQLQPQPTAELAEASVDLDRQRRCGFPEVVYGEGKSVASIEAICGELLAAGQPVLVTRVEQPVAERLQSSFPDLIYNQTARTLRIQQGSIERAGNVCVVSAGTSDAPVVEEAFETADWAGAHVEWIRDVGVAGPLRLPPHLPKLLRADAIVVVAGMEGALPSVVGGHVACPVFAVPTSVGYGASFGGLAALLGMLNSCAANVAVVNIDAGFKAGYLAALIARRTAR